MKINKITRTYNMTIAHAEKIYHILDNMPVDNLNDHRIAFLDTLGEMIRECYDYKGMTDFTFTGTKKEHQFFNKIFKEV